MVTASIRLHTLFIWCNDVAEMREFYTHLLGLSESFYQNDRRHGWLTYHVDDTQLVFMRAPQELPIQNSWARQPGYAGGDSTAKSWLLTMSCSDFEMICERVKHSDIPIYDNPHDYDASRQLFIKDPMGMTIELSVEE